MKRRKTALLQGMRPTRAMPDHPPCTPAKRGVPARRSLTGAPRSLETQQTASEVEALFAPDAPLSVC